MFGTVPSQLDTLLPAGNGAEKLEITNAHRLAIASGLKLLSSLPVEYSEEEKAIIANNLGISTDVAKFTRLTYRPVNTDTIWAVLVSGVLTMDGITPITVSETVPLVTSPALIPNFYENTLTGTQVYPDGTANVDPWFISFTGAVWESGSNQNLDEAAFSPQGVNTGIPEVAYLTRPKTTGQFVEVDDEVNPVTHWQNFGNDETPNWKQTFPADAFLLKAFQDLSFAERQQVSENQGHPSYPSRELANAALPSGTIYFDTTLGYQRITTA